MSFYVINPNQTFYDSTGAPRAGGFVTFFVNTTSTKGSIYSDEALTVAQNNPYELDASGRMLGDVKYSGLMTMQVTNSDGSDVSTNDNVSTVETSSSLRTDLAASGGSGLVGFIQSGTGAVATTSQTEMRRHIFVEQFGAVGDGVTNDLAAITAAIAAAPAGAVIKGTPGAIYNFGDIAGDAVAVAVTKYLIFDWQGAKLLCAGNNGAAYTATTLFKFTDCKTDMRNYTFEDSNFNLSSGPSRGVLPVWIHNAAADTEGHSVGPCHIIKGQSLVTVTSSTPDTYRARGIKLVSPCTADDIYYGINLAKNGDDVSGEFSAASCNRAIFVYGVRNFDARFYVETGQPASANVFVSHANSATAAQNTDTSDIKVRGHFGTLDGAIVVADQPRDLVTGAGIYKNIDIECQIDAIGSNLQNGATNNFPLIKIGAFDTGGAYITTEITQTIEDLRVRILPALTINTHGKLTSPVTIYAPSPNYGTFEFPIEDQATRDSTIFPENAGGDTFRVSTIKTDGWYFRAVNGALTDGAAGVTRTLYIPLKYIAPIQRNSIIAVDLQISAYKTLASGVYTMADYYVMGFAASTGAITVVSAYQKSIRNTGGITTTIAITAADPYASGVNDHIAITLVDSAAAGGYNDAAAQMVVKVTPVA